MSQLRYLLEEICAGVEVYFTGRSGGQYLKTAFILCDDYTELTSKLFLLTDDPTWSDGKPPKKPGGKTSGFKNYHAIQADVKDVIKSKRSGDLPRITHLHTEMSARRTRRNDFFHSTKLLDLNVSQARCVDARCRSPRRAGLREVFHQINIVANTPFLLLNRDFSAIILNLIRSRINCFSKRKSYS